MTPVVRTQGLVSLKIAAEILGCGMSTLRTWDNDGSLKAVRTPGGQRRYRMEDLERVQREGLRMPGKEFVPNTVNIPTALHRIAKVEAAKEGVTLQAWIIEAMKLRAESLESSRSS